MEEIVIDAPRRNSKKNAKPPIIDWQGVPMVRNQSIRAAANEIMNMSSNQDLVAVNMEGKQSTGKTECAVTLSHLIHQMDDEPFDVVRIGKDEFINLEETVAKLKPMNNIIIFDDIAFLKAGATTKQIDQIQSVLATIRHLPGGKDVRIIMFKLFQYSKSLPPFLRQNDVTIVSSVDDNEVKSLQDRFPRHMDKIEMLRKMRVQIKMGSKNQAFFDYPMGNKKREKMYHRYHAKHPFLPYFYFNGNSGRIIVSPLRTWIDPVCPICDGFAEEKDEKAHQSFTAFKEELMAKYDANQRTYTHAVKVTLVKLGINCFSPKVVQAVKLCENYLSKSKMPKEDFMKGFNLTETKTRLDGRTKAGKRYSEVAKEVNPLKEKDDT